MSQLPQATPCATQVFNMYADDSNGETLYNVWPARKYEGKWLQVTLLDQAKRDAGYVPNCRINASIDVYRSTALNKCFVLVNMDGSHAAASKNGKMFTDKYVSTLSLHEDTRVKGLFLREVQVEIDVEGISHSEYEKVLQGKPGKGVRFDICKDTPGTTLEDGTVSSSIAYNINPSVDPSGPSLSGGVSITSSFSKTIRDISINNLSDGKFVKHVYRLTKTDSAVFNKDDDLVDKGPDAMARGFPIRDFSPVASANWDILSQALFVCDTSDIYQVGVGLKITSKSGLIVSQTNLFDADCKVYDFDFGLYQGVSVRLSKDTELDAGVRK